MNLKMLHLALNRLCHQLENVSDFERSISKYVGSKYAVATSSGTTALHLSLITSDVGFNDYVIVPNITFIKL